jgi:hypothetical protein
MKDYLIECINDIANLPDEDKVKIGKKLYTTVDKRVQVFRKHFGSYGRITTNVIFNDLERVVVEATIAVFMNNDWVIVGNDFAEEFRSQGPVNKTSALENCCTSAIGRALASCGLGGGEYASSFEVDNAINTKPSAPNLNEGYTFRSPKGSVLEHSVDETQFLKVCRTYIGDPTADQSKELFLKNKEDIITAKDKATKKADIEAYGKLLELYQEENESE